MATKVLNHKNAQCRILQHLQENQNLKSVIVRLIIMRLFSPEFSNQICKISMLIKVMLFHI
jgi:hypothetical protein